MYRDKIIEEGEVCSSVTCIRPIHNAVQQNVDRIENLFDLIDAQFKATCDNEKLRKRLVTQYGGQKIT